ncbi:hypothetical protein [Nakamurella leprariae]|uniref:Uncharacterized protein n=1 Tax=Nakamurella leprariae TaxID=2803911 RepID=A0A939C077_9ACTN|nr:hypothetical protein [Nakamurella leprariae]MBM9468940.1 hypothetical protein [Nakamurella leprariae]
MVTHSHRMSGPLFNRTSPVRARPRAVSWSIESALLVVAVLVTWWAFLPVQPTETRVLGTAAVLLGLLVVGWWWMPPYLALGLIAATITIAVSIHEAATFTVGLHWSFGSALIALGAVIGGCVVIAVLEGLDELWARMHRS